MSGDGALLVFIAALVIIAIGVGFLLGAAWMSERARWEADERLRLAYRCQRGAR